MATPLVTIQGYALRDPSEYEANTATIVDSARNSDGYMIGGVIRNDVAKISMSWRYISTAEWSTILKLFSPTYGGNFTQSVTFFNQLTGGWETRTMYVSDRSAKIFKRDEDGNIQGYLGAKLSLIEV